MDSPRFHSRSFEFRIRILSSFLLRSHAEKLSNHIFNMFHFFLQLKHFSNLFSFPSNDFTWYRWDESLRTLWRRYANFIQGHCTFNPLNIFFFKHRVSGCLSILYIALRGVLLWFKNFLYLFTQMWKPKEKWSFNASVFNVNSVKHKRVSLILLFFLPFILTWNNFQ